MMKTKADRTNAAQYAKNQRMSLESSLENLKAAEDAARGALGAIIDLQCITQNGIAACKMVENTPNAMSMRALDENRAHDRAYGNKCRTRIEMALDKMNRAKIDEAV